MSYEEMVFMKRTIFPFLIKVRPSLRDSAFSLRFPVENFRMVKFSTGKTLRKRRDGRKRDSEGENCDRRSACATRKRTVREPLFMPYPGMRPLSSPAVVKALLLPLHCICGLFRLYPRQPVLPALSLVETACRNRRRDTNFSGYGGPFRKIHRTFVHRKRLLNYILCIRFFIEVHSIVSASRFFHMPTYLRVVIECQFRFFPFFPAFSRNCPDYFLHTSGSSSFRSLSDLGAR